MLLDAVPKFVLNANDSLKLNLAIRSSTANVSRATNAPCQFINSLGVVSTTHVLRFSLVSMRSPHSRP